MVDDAMAMDLWLRAQIVLNTPSSSSAAAAGSRRTRRAKNPKSPSLAVRLGWLYYFVRDRNRTAFRQQLRALFSKA